MRRIAITITTALAAASVMTACGSSDNKKSAPGGGGHLSSIAYGSAADSSEIYKTLGDAMVSYGKGQGLKMSRYDNDLDPSKALSNAQLMVAQHPDVIADAAAGEVNESLGKVFTRAKIPCIGVVLSIPGCAFLNFNRAKSGSESADAAAAAIAKRGWKGADVTVLLDTAALGGAPLYVYQSSFYTTFAAKVAGVQQVPSSKLTLSTTTVGTSLVQVDGKATLDGSNAAVKQAIQRIPKTRHLVVVATNDDMAIGAISALDQGGWKGNYVLTSQGGTAQALAHLRANDGWSAEGDPTFAVWPSYIYAMAQALHQGKKLPAQTDSPQLTLTPDNVDTYYQGTKLVKVPPVPASDSYLTPFFAK